jgi:hypothetical protein
MQFRIFVASFFGALLAVACLDTSPTVTLGRDAGTTDAGALVLPGELLPADPPNCLDCAAAKSSDLRTNRVCTGDRTATRPNSSTRFAAFLACACRTSCASACADSCSGAPMTTACELCTSASCATERAACEAP